LSYNIFKNSTVSCNVLLVFFLTVSNKTIVEVSFTVHIHRFGLGPVGLIPITMPNFIPIGSGISFPRMSDFVEGFFSNPRSRCRTDFDAKDACNIGYLLCSYPKGSLLVTHSNQD